MTPRQERFVQEYLIDLNATAAYQRAGYKATGRAAAANAARLLTNAKVQAAIQTAQVERARRTGIDADRVLKELAAVALSDLGELVEFTEQGIRFKPAGHVSEAARRAVAGIKVRHEAATDSRPAADIIEFKLWPKVEALRQLAQHLGLLKPQEPFRVDVTSGGKPIEQRNTLTPADIAAAAALVGAAGVSVQANR